ncbi:MAG: ferrous iron transport protein B [bacterium]
MTTLKPAVPEAPAAASIARRLRRGRRRPAPTRPVEAPLVLLGHPNVGKSVLFGAMTRRFVTVSNYPGTTVELSYGTLGVDADQRTVIDTPGVQGLVPWSEDEWITRQVLLDHPDATAVVVVDTKNIRRGMTIVMEVAESGLPMVVVLNMADEAARRGIAVDVARLSDRLGVPVISMVATRRTGLDTLLEALPHARPATCRSGFDVEVEQAVHEIAPRLPSAAISPRALALMYLAGDDRLLDGLDMNEADRRAVPATRERAAEVARRPLAAAIGWQRLRQADAILNEVRTVRRTHRPWRERLGRAASHPLWGWPILGAILLLVYQIVGVFGAGTLVDLFEQKLFANVINPWASSAVEAVVPVTFVQEALVGEYGLITMGLTYSVAIVLPIVGMFFLVFSVLEDSGYLPRLAVMLDRVFRALGLNGKAVLPMILGLGCDTMATMTTRILETRKERLIVTLLLALGVPCSAQLGVLLGMMAGLGAAAVMIWAAVVLSTFLVVGFCAARLVPGQPPPFILEMPPLRMPTLRNIVVKTLARMEWYLKEVVPVFLIATFALYLMHKTGLLTVIERVMAPLISGWLGLPEETAGVFLIGFLRRDYGAAGLFAFSREGLLAPAQVLVSLVVITLFMPCIAHLLIMIKEHGAKTALRVAGLVFAISFLVGGLLHWTMRLAEVAMN